MTDATIFVAEVGRGQWTLPDGRGSDKHSPTVRPLPSRAR